ncbi:MAG: hypothetical protein ACK4OF_01430 [Aquificaceae bacterium]
MILRRFRAGDCDVMLKAYGPCGMVKVFVPEAFLPERCFLAYIEPFNLLHMVYQQSGEILFLKDIIDVRFFSYLCIEDYSRYVWMNSLTFFMEKWFIQYDSEIFKLALRYLTLKTKNYAVFLIKFKLEFIKRLGLYREDLFDDSLKEVINFIAKEDKLLKLERLRVSQNLILEMDKALEDHLSKSL